MRRVVNGLLRLWLWQIGDSNLATDARLLLIPVRERGLTGNRLLRIERIRKKGGKGESGEGVELCEV